VLAEKPENPFTLTRLTKRQLVVLTKDNYAAYASTIVEMK
jgi:hypothetical protein